MLMLTTASAGLAQSAQRSTAQFEPSGAPTTYSLPVASERIEYGDLSGQEIRFHPARGGALAPLVIYISSAWSDGQGYDLDDDLAGFAYQRGYASAFVGYHGLESPNADEVLGDYAAALRRLADEAPERGIDMSRIVIVARGGAAGFAALLATEPAWLESAGLPFGALRGVILLNGDGFDLAPRLADSDGRLDSEFEYLFGEGAGRLARYSPVSHLDPPNAPAFLLIAEERKASIAEASQSFAERLNGAGVANRLVLVPRHIRTERVGTFSTRPTDTGQAATEFLEAAFN